jgi:hypothetical protein
MAHPTGFEPVTSAFGGQRSDPAELRVLLLVLVGRAIAKPVLRRNATDGASWPVSGRSHDGEAAQQRCDFGLAMATSFGKDVFQLGAHRVDADGVCFGEGIDGFAPGYVPCHTRFGWRQIKQRLHQVGRRHLRS